MLMKKRPAPDYAALASLLPPQLRGVELSQSLIPEIAKDNLDLHVRT